MTKMKDLILGLATLLIGLLYIQQTLQLPKGEHLLNSSQSFPLLIGVMLVLLALILLVKCIMLWKKDRDEKKLEINIPALKRGLFYVIITSLYIFMFIPWFGFLIGTVIFMITTILFYKEVKWYTPFIVTTGTLFVVYYVFNKLMFINFPGM